MRGACSGRSKRSKRRKEEKKRESKRRGRVVVGAGTAAADGCGDSNSDGGGAEGLASNSRPWQ